VNSTRGQPCSGLRSKRTSVSLAHLSVALPGRHTAQVSSTQVLPSAEAGFTFGPMRLLTAVTLLLLVFAPASRAQERSQGSPSELKGLRRVYVDAGASRKDRARIVEELQKSKVGIEIVDAPERAELILLFSADKVTTAAGMEQQRDVLGNPNGKTEPRYVDVDAGYGSAYVPASGDGRRILFTWSGRKQLFASPAQKFAKAFVKEYRKANGQE
jgi:hypothetical protein